MSKPFPTFDLSRKPTANTWKFQKLIDPTIRAPFESGIPLSRSRFTAPVPKLYTYTINFLTAADITILDEFEDHVKVGGSMFEWRHPITNKDWEMRLNSQIFYGIEDGTVDKYFAQIEMYGKEVQKMRQAIIRIEDLAANADILDRPIFVNTKAITIESIGILTEDAPAGIDDSNTAFILIEDDSFNIIVTKTYNTATQPPSSDYEDLGNVDNASLNAGEHLLFSITQGTTANMPAFSIIIEYYYT